MFSPKTISQKRVSHRFKCLDRPYKRRSISNDSEIHLVNEKKDNNSTMIKITNNCNDFLQAYASGDSSGDSKAKDKSSLENKPSRSSIFGQTQKPSHVRFNSLANISNKFNNHKKLKYKDGKMSKDDLVNVRNILGEVDQNASHIMNSSVPYFPPTLVKSHSLYQKHPDDSRESSDGILNFSYENMQGNQGLEKENIGLLESHQTNEEKMEEVPSLTSMMYANQICKVTYPTNGINQLIVGINKPKEVQEPSETYRERPKCNCKKSKCLKLYCDCFTSGLGCKD
jgi:hypothetical protein